MYRIQTLHVLKVLSTVVHVVAIFALQLGYCCYLQNAADNWSFTVDDGSVSFDDESRQYSASLRMLLSVSLRHWLCSTNSAMHHVPRTP